MTLRRERKSLNTRPDEIFLKFHIFPLRANFIEIRHKKNSSTYPWVSVTLSLCHSVANKFQNRPILGRLATSRFYKWPILTTQTRTIHKGALRFATQTSPLLNLYFLMFVFLTTPALPGGPEVGSMCTQLTL